jgi:hydroxymethylpyrimidine/phosphomethylpyrimidine kinase
VADLRAGGIASLIPEVGSNLGMALPGATRPEEVAAWEGRIVRVGDDLHPVGSPRFGASRHIATVIVTAMRFDPRARSAMNLRYSGEIVGACERAGLQVATCAWTDAPPEVKAEGGSRLAWGVAKAIQASGAVPDLISDAGDVGREAMVRVLGHDPLDVAHKVLAIRRQLFQAPR